LPGRVVKGTKIVRFEETVPPEDNGTGVGLRNVLTPGANANRSMRPEKPFLLVTVMIVELYPPGGVDSDGFDVETEKSGPFTVTVTSVRWSVEQPDTPLTVMV